MRFGLALALVYCSMCLHAQQACVANKPLFNNEVHFKKDVAVNPLAFNQPENNISQPLSVFRLQLPDRLPVFCAIEKSISQKFNFPVRIRLDDRKYEYK